jgi:hypothetical protein
LVALRTTGRAWLEALERLAGDIDAGRAMDLDQFDALIGPLRSDATRKADEMSLVGRPVASAGGPPPQPVGRDVLDSYGISAFSDVMGKLRCASDAVRDDLRRATPGLRARISPAAWQFLDAARRARAAFNTTLLAQIDAMTAPSYPPAAINTPPTSQSVQTRSLSDPPPPRAPAAWSVPSGPPPNWSVPSPPPRPQPPA